MTGTLFIVVTPIGNLDDITFRAVEGLKSVDIVLAEDTRHSNKLLSHLDISKHIRAFHAEKRFPCELCMKSFTSHDKLKIHLD